MTEIKSFTKLNKREDVQFEVDGEVFTAVGVAPAMAFLDVAAVNSAKDLDKVRIIVEFLDQVLLEESAVRFAERLKSATAPIDIEQCTAVAVWLVQEVYSPERPTEAPSPSEDGSGSNGSTSTPGAQSEGSTPATSTRLAV